MHIEVRALDRLRVRMRRRVGSTRRRGNHMHDHSRFQRDINDVTGVSLSLSLPLTKVTDAQYRKRFRASYNDCLQPPVRKVLAFMLCRFTDVRHAPSEPSAKRTLADGDRRERCEVRPPPAVIPLCMNAMDGVPDKKLAVVDHQLRESIAGVRGERAR